MIADLDQRINLHAATLWLRTSDMPTSQLQHSGTAHHLSSSTVNGVALGQKL